MKKKILALTLVVVLAATAVIGGTLAYFTDDDAQTNTFTVGNVKIDLTEPKWEDVGSKDAETVYPGEPLAKDPTVGNVGKNPCFVRVQVTNLNQFGDKGDITLRYQYKDGYNTADWTYINGYYYYNRVLEVGQNTNPVFDQIVMPKGLTGDEETKDIVVTAEAVQAQGARASWSEVLNMSAPDIADWFGTAWTK